ncbi:MAG TPA: c-type cytochrome [Bacteroidota bacterium]|nr:c-type cytochrome [Bacteroidota bacterium]
MKKVLKWIAIIVPCLAVIGFIAFLYLIPPFDLLPREALINPHTEAVASSLQKIDDPAERALAERGQYIMSYSDCSDCHTPQGDKGPNWDEFLAGGAKFETKKFGTVYTRNLTPDKETGLARRTDEEIDRVLRSGVFHDGRAIVSTEMPWPAFSHLTKEDRYALIVYLRHIKPIWHKSPEWSPNSSGAQYLFYPYDYGETKKEK